ncbi:hypothetical protein CTI14_70845, partial [Methylobacterium radiotolerans]
IQELQAAVDTLIVIPNQNLFRVANEKTTFADAFMRTAESGIQELQAAVDTLIVIPNQNLFRVANEKTTFADAF